MQTNASRPPAILAAHFCSRRSTPLRINAFQRGSNFIPSSFCISLRCLSNVRIVLLRSFARIARTVIEVYFFPLLFKREGKPSRLQPPASRRCRSDNTAPCERSCTPCTGLRLKSTGLRNQRGLRTFPDRPEREDSDSIRLTMRSSTEKGSTALESYFFRIDQQPYSRDDLLHPNGRERADLFDKVRLIDSHDWVTFTTLSFGRLASPF